MSIYYCKGCEKLVDDDWHPMQESELCPDCDIELEEKTAMAREYEQEQRDTHRSLLREMS